MIESGGMRSTSDGRSSWSNGIRSNIIRPKIYRISDRLAESARRFLTMRY